jgi:hypothetical protein
MCRVGRAVSSFNMTIADSTYKKLLDSGVEAPVVKALKDSLSSLPEMSVSPFKSEKEFRQVLGGLERLIEAKNAEVMQEACVQNLARNTQKDPCSRAMAGESEDEFGEVEAEEGLWGNKNWEESQ